MKDGLKLALGLILCLLVGLIVGIAVERIYGGGHDPAPGGKTVEVYVDTIPFYKPVPRDSVVLRYEVVTLPVVPAAQNEEQPDTLIASAATTENGDSARVLIPITQTTYHEDNLYTAYVSGYRARLDSIFVYPRREVVTIKKPPKRWSIGIQAGYGYTPKGFQPYVGVGISCRLAEF